MPKPVWLLKRTVLALHDEQLARHGGPSGLRDEGLLESALARPENLFAYGKPDLAELAQPTHSVLPRTTPLWMVTNGLLLSPASHSWFATI